MNHTRHSASYRYGRASRDAGFTITEVLIAVFVLAIGLIGVISVFPVGIHATRKTLNSAASATVAQGALAHMLYDVDVSDNNALDLYLAGSAIYRFYPDNTDSRVVTDIGVDRYVWNALIGQSPVLRPAANRLMMVQFAFFRDGANTVEGPGKAGFLNPSAHPSADPREVYFYSGTTPLLPIVVTAGKYIRCYTNDANYKPSRWYLIDEVDNENKKIILAEPYEAQTPSASSIPPQTTRAKASYLIATKVYQTTMTVK